MAWEVVILIVSATFSTVGSIVSGIVLWNHHREKTRGDKAEQDIQQLKETCVKNDDFKELRDTVSDLHNTFATKEEVREIKQKMDRMNDNLDFIKENCVRNSEFVRLVTRLEGKIDAINERR